MELEEAASRHPREVVIQRPHGRALLRRQSADQKIRKPELLPGSGRLSSQESISFHVSPSGKKVGNAENRRRRQGRSWSEAPTRTSIRTGAASATKSASRISRRCVASTASREALRCVGGAQEKSLSKSDASCSIYRCIGAALAGGESVGARRLVGASRRRAPRHQ